MAYVTLKDTPGIFVGSQSHQIECLWMDWETSIRIPALSDWESKSKWRFAIRKLIFAHFLTNVTRKMLQSIRISFSVTKHSGNIVKRYMMKLSKSPHSRLLEKIGSQPSLNIFSWRRLVANSRGYFGWNSRHSRPSLSANTGPMIRHVSTL